MVLNIQREVRGKIDCGMVIYPELKATQCQQVWTEKDIRILVVHKYIKECNQCNEQECKLTFRYTNNLYTWLYIDLTNWT